MREIPPADKEKDKRIPSILAWIHAKILGIRT